MYHLTCNPCYYWVFYLYHVCIILLYQLTFVSLWGDMMASKQSRKWQLTINNPLDHGYAHKDIIVKLSSIKQLTYWCMCDEIGLNGTYHTHLFLYSVNPKRFDTIKNLFQIAHIEAAKGTIQENRDYIRKEGKYADSVKAETNLKDTFEESGEAPEEKQGKRTDLIDLYGYIKDGLSDYEILELDPSYMSRLELMDKTRQIIRYKEFEERCRSEIEVTYRYGKTGTGKSRSIIDKYGFKNVYRVTDNKHPFDSYAGQDVIVFEEFYSSNWRLSDMLNLLDVYPLKLPCRYNNKQACYTKVFINSNLPLTAQYTNQQKDNVDAWQAFCRRIHKVQIYKDKDQIETYDTQDYFNNRWVSVDDPEYKQMNLLFD